MPLLGIRVGMIDPSAKADATFSINDLKPWSNINDLSIDGIQRPPNIATLESNFRLLDGTFEEFTVDTSGIRFVMFSNSQSNDNGIYVNPPTVIILFSGNHKSNGLTPHFYNDCGYLLHTTWYDGWQNIGGNIVFGNELAFNETLWRHSGDEIREPVENYQAIKFQIISSTIRHRHVKMYAFDFGVLHSFEDYEISKCEILEEIDPKGEILSVNTMDFTVKTHDSMFDPLSGDPADNMFMRKQPVYLTVSGSQFGTYFLKTPPKDVHNTGTTFSFQTEDSVGLMDNYTFLGGIYVNKPIGELLDEIFEVAFPTQHIGYDLEPELRGKLINGWLPIMSCREALHHVCFSIGAVADCSRRHNIWIYARDTDLTYEIEHNQIYVGGKIEPTPYNSGLDMMFYSITQNNEELEVFNATLTSGFHELRFDEPLWNISVTGGSIIERGANYVRINVNTQGTVRVVGRQHTLSEAPYRLRDSVIAGEIESVQEYKDCFLININNVEEIAISVFDYLKQRFTIESDIRLNNMEVGYVASMKTQTESTKSLPIIGTIESLVINPRAGRASAKVTGNLDLSKLEA